MAETFDFDECIDILQRGIVDALTNRGEAIRKLHAAAAFDAVAFNVVPWDPFLGLAFRLASEANSPVAANPGKWEHSLLIEADAAETLSEAQEYVRNVYQTLGAALGSKLEAAHVLLLAAANALLDADVVELLQSFGIDAREIDDELKLHAFKYYVLDAGRTVEANYCDIIWTNRVTDRLFDGGCDDEECEDEDCGHDHEDN